jgi:hypothetical protein
VSVNRGLEPLPLLFVRGLDRLPKLRKTILLKEKTRPTGRDDCRS